MSNVPWISIWLVAWFATVIIARVRRSAAFAIMTAIFLGISILVWSALFRGQTWGTSIMFILQASMFAHYIALSKPEMRPLWYRIVVSWPASYLGAASFLMIPWAFASALGATPYLWWLPCLACVGGLYQSLHTKKETVPINLDRSDLGELSRATLPVGVKSRKLRIIQLSDPHLGPFMSKQRLFDICERAVDQNPDLVLLTGDFLTMESQGDPSVLTYALSPLKVLSGKVFACRGNHDLEASQTVTTSCRANDIELLIDEAVTIEIASHSIEIISFDYRMRPKAKIDEFLAELAPLSSTLRLAMLHDPGAFKHLPNNTADLVFSGHTHGGQVGLLSFGIGFTLMRLFANIPDFGYWSNGTNRLYVNRGVGHYGIPLRVGVPAEESVIELSW